MANNRAGTLGLSVSMKPQKLTVMLQSTRLHVPSSSNCFPNMRGMREKTKSHDYRRRRKNGSLGSQELFQDIKTKVPGLLYQDDINIKFNVVIPFFLPAAADDE